MIVELWTRKRKMADEDENDVEDTSDMKNQGYDLPDWVGMTSCWCNYMPDGE